MTSNPLTKTQKKFMKEETTIWQGKQSVVICNTCHIIIFIHTFPYFLMNFIRTVTTCCKKMLKYKLKRSVEKTGLILVRDGEIKRYNSLLKAPVYKHGWNMDHQCNLKNCVPLPCPAKTKTNAQSLRRIKSNTTSYLIQE